MKLFSYVVDHDNGFAPNPYYGVCTLAHCKFGVNGKKNVVELAQKGDWVVGTGGRGKRSVGHGKLIYAMRVDEKLTLKKYYYDVRFQKKKRRKNGSYRQGQGDNLNKAKHLRGRYVIISRRYFYFGRNAIKIPIRFREHPIHPLEKKGPGFRSRFNEKFVTSVVGWLNTSYRTGILGNPCGYTLHQEQNMVNQSCR